MNAPTFAPGTAAVDAQAMTLAALQTIAGGWPALYFRPSAIQGGNQSLDLDSMIHDAVRLAVQCQSKALAALPEGSRAWQGEDTTK